MKRCIFLIFFLLGMAVAEENRVEYQDYINDATIVASSGIGGALLGLSTLPFTRKPTGHFRHVLVGGSLGLIAGVAYVSFLQATKTQKQYTYFVDSPKRIEGNSNNWFINQLKGKVYGPFSVSLTF